MIKRIISLGSNFHPILERIPNPRQLISLGKREEKWEEEKFGSRGGAGLTAQRSGYRRAVIL